MNSASDFGFVSTPPPPYRRGDLTIEVSHPDPMPSDFEVRAGISAALEVFSNGGSLEDAERAALSACFKDWAECPESAGLLVL